MALYLLCQVPGNIILFSFSNVYFGLSRPTADKSMGDKKKEEKNSPQKEYFLFPPFLSLFSSKDS